MSIQLSQISKEEELAWLRETVLLPDITDSLQALTRLFADKTVFSTSFSMEDQVILHHLFENNLSAEVFTLDTGRLFPETYSTWSATLEKYNKTIKVYTPDTLALEEYIHLQGPNGFYNSVEQRQACCHIRKVEPLKRALAGKKLWITGIRAEHSPNRTGMEKLEWDEANQVFKFHPLLNWTTDEVLAFVKANAIPINPLHEKGFISIGCQPCTRAIQPGEDFRAGRWWWEDASKKECGLHVHK